jgi:hypothetical protein
VHPFLGSFVAREIEQEFRVERRRAPAQPRPFRTVSQDASTVFVVETSGHTAWVTSVQVALERPLF